MLGNIWLTSAAVVTVIFSTSVAYKTYSDLQDAKHIQESYDLISEIKSLLAKQYNKSPEDITRDEIIAYLPSGGNWEKVLLSNRQDSSTLSNNELVDEDGNFIINESEKLKLFALRAKLHNFNKDDSDENINSEEKVFTKKDNKYTIKVGLEDKNTTYKDDIISSQITKTIEIIDLNLSGINQSKLDLIIEEFTPYNKIYHNMKLDDIEEPTVEQIKTRKESFFKSRIKEQLISSTNSKDIKIYNTIKDLL